MADLDDFFAKKDRKKNKGKKFTTTDEIAKKLEETGKKIEKTKKEKPVQPPQVPGQEGEEQIIVIPDEDEWKDFEEEKKDYTGLKIGNLTITEGQPEGGDGDGDEEGGMEENEAGEMVPRKKVAAGPWKMVHTPQAEPPPPPAPVVVERQQGSTGPSSYVPPHLRAGAQPRESPHGHSSGSRLKNRAAPDINNENFFPTLSAAKTTEPAGAWGKKVKVRFVKHNNCDFSKLASTDLFRASHTDLLSHPRSPAWSPPTSGDSRPAPPASNVYRHPNFKTPGDRNNNPRPELSTAPLSWRRDEGVFEEVRGSKSHHGRGWSDVATMPGQGGPKLSLGNKYDALDNNDQS